ncbi:MAG: DUF4835 family protein [Bacteroidales bacterium]|nr:DUF4835 family protein [Bacteroidales bacterium]
MNIAHIPCLRPLAIVFLALVATIAPRAQELNCRVEVNYSQLAQAQESVFTTLQEAINDYMNTNIFSNAQFAVNEKIECQLYITVKEYSDGLIKGDLQIQSTRPVYNSAYTTTILNFKDSKIDFEYQEGDQLIYSINTMESQLTAILNYYAYLILALDFDTFSRRGGDPYYEKLRQIVLQGQSSGNVGWKAFEDTKNRSAVLSALTDNSTQMLRDLLYEYHLTGLDQMSVSPEKGRAAIHKSLQYIKQVYSAAPMSVGLSMFKDAKMDELVNIYSKATAEERKDAYELLQPIYPAESSRLDKIKKGAEK